MLPVGKDTPDLRGVRGQRFVDLGFDDVDRRTVRYEPQFVDVGLTGSSSLTVWLGGSSTGAMSCLKRTKPFGATKCDVSGFDAAGNLKPTALERERRPLAETQSIRDRHGVKEPVDSEHLLTLSDGLPDRFNVDQASTYSFADRNAKPLEPTNECVRVPAPLRAALRPSAGRAGRGSGSSQSRPL